MIRRCAFTFLFALLGAWLVAAISAMHNRSPWWEGWSESGQCLFVVLVVVAALIGGLSGYLGNSGKS